MQTPPKAGNAGIFRNARSGGVYARACRSPFRARHRSRPTAWKPYPSCLGKRFFLITRGQVPAAIPLPLALLLRDMYNRELLDGGDAPFDNRISYSAGVWRSLVSARRSGRRGRRFKSSHPDHFILPAHAEALARIAPKNAVKKPSPEMPSARSIHLSGLDKKAPGHGGFLIAIY
jgi:hypothetical protein